MLSRREEERNEKIIRGLMKLPPNRKCINCNSLGPQYVCINFWTFVCMTCSGIHREFTHRVKSVSMAKFTSQEVEALQNGGNQRARETYLKDWDYQQQRLPENSNVDRIREFIKNVYVDNKYAGGKNSDRPPRDLQRIKSQEDEKRRASSYHSYSQSPPYDHQYEDRKYGKPGAVLTRKPGSDRGLYEGKISGFVYSPRLSVRSYDDRFANDVSRASDYSVSSGGDPFRSETQSPSSQVNVGFSSPPIHLSEDILIEDPRHKNTDTYSEANDKRDIDTTFHQQRTASWGSLGSTKSSYSASLADVISEPQQTLAPNQDNKSAFASVTQPSYSANSGSLNFFEAPVAPQPVTSSPIDFFQLPTMAAPPSVNLFQTDPVVKPPSASLQHAYTSPPAFLDLFADLSEELPVTTTGDKLTPQVSMPKNEGWATFDTPQCKTSTQSIDNIASTSSTNEDALGKFNTVLSSDASMQWPSVQSSSAHGTFSSISGPWDENPCKAQTFSNATSTEVSHESWNAFEDSLRSHNWESMHQNSGPRFTSYEPSSVANQYLGLGVQEDFTKAETFRPASGIGNPVSVVSSHALNGPSHASLAPPSMGAPLHATELSSTNPFDIPFEANLGTGSMFLDMSSVQAALPDTHTQTSFLGEVNQPWFSQNSVTTFLPATTQGGLAYMGGQVPSAQLPNVKTQAPIASMGGNPFA